MDPVSHRLANALVATNARVRRSRSRCSARSSNSKTSGSCRGRRGVRAVARRAPRSVERTVQSSRSDRGCGSVRGGSARGRIWRCPRHRRDADARQPIDPSRHDLGARQNSKARVRPAAPAPSAWPARRCASAGSPSDSRFAGRQRAPRVRPMPLTRWVDRLRASASRRCRRHRQIPRAPSRPAYRTAAAIRQSRR